MHCLPLVDAIHGAYGALLEHEVDRVGGRVAGRIEQPALVGVDHLAEHAACGLDAGRPTPTFTGRNSGLPSASMIDSTPWLPPSPPPRRSFTRPGLTSTSSWIRTRSASPTPRLRHSRATASPESFMKVCGLPSSTV